MGAQAPVHGGEILDFSANINPYGPPASALTAARAAIGASAAYPEPYARSLRAALAARHGVPDQAVMAGNGAAEVIHLPIRQAAGHSVAVPSPGFAEYGRAATAVGARRVPYAARDCRSFVGLTEHHMRVAVRSRADNARRVEALATP